MNPIQSYINDIKRFPKTTWNILGNEAAERFSFYGMKAILTTFLAHGFYASLGKPEAAANSSTHLFIAGCYLFSIAGGILADWFIGKYRTIFWLSLVYCMGHLTLALSENNQQAFMLGLLLIALGAGGIKPCVSANVGDQFDDANRDLSDKLYDVFYISINFGAFFGQILIPIIFKNYSVSLAFGVPGIAMGIATIIFWLGRKKYKYVPPSGIPKITFLGISFYAFSKLFSDRKGKSIWLAAEDKYKTENINNTLGVWKAIICFAFVPVFWACYDQNGSEWVLQAEKMDLNFMGHVWIAEQVQSINAILILVFVPLFTIFLYPLIGKLGFEMTPLRKMGIGFFLMVVTFALTAYVQAKIDAGSHPNIAWQLLGYIIITASEVMVSVTGLQYAYNQAPISMKSTVMAFWLLTVFIGNIFVSMINDNIETHGFFSRFQGADYFWFFCALMGVTTVVFVFVAAFLMPKEVKKQG